MKTIEERATELADRFKAQQYFDDRVNDAVANAVYEAAIIMANEQNAIVDSHFREVTKMLIDKACKAHCSCCMAYKACSHRGKFYCWELDKIRKAMEE